jgi:ParB-like chromosome segregation protein Spo0J
MPTGGSYELIRIEEIDLDTSNPRIAHFLQAYPEPYTAEQLHLALMAGSGDDAGAGTSFDRLRQSVQTNGGVIQPVIVRRLNDRYVCIEGNTRVFLYRDFKDKGVSGTWERIPAIVHDDLDEEDIHAIRLQAHLVGPRPWDAYSKAKYLYHLRMKENVPLAQLVDLCGGNQRAIVESINAYEDMEKYYRPLVGDEGFEPDRFSGFVELQKSTIKQDIIAAEFTLDDFARWIHERRIKRLADVRQLSNVLKNDKARQVFLKSGIEDAVSVLDRPMLNKHLQEADLGSLARALAHALDGISHREVKKMQQDPSSETVQYLHEALEALTAIIADLD